MRSVIVGITTITPMNSYGPDGRDPIVWLVKVGPGEIQLGAQEIAELLVALTAWREVNP